MGRAVFKLRLLDDDAVIPQYATKGSAGMDICVLHPKHDQGLFQLTDNKVKLAPGRAALFHTGLALEIPEGLAGFLYPRSGVGHKRGIILGNGTGIIDSDYRGELFVSLYNRSSSPKFIAYKDKVAQLVFMPVVQAGFLRLAKLSDTDRDTGGFGSTGL